MIIIRDSNEQDPFPFVHPVQQQNLHKDGLTGDYTIKGMEKIVCLERKRGEELWGCLGSKREFFKHQLERMAAYPIRILLVEGSLEDFSHKPRYSQLTWSLVSYRLMRWTIRHAIPIWFLGPRSAASVRLVEDQLTAIWDLYRRDRKMLANWKGMMK